MSDNSPLLRIAVPVPLRRSFDYLPPDKVDPTVLQPGIRVLVPFGSQKLVGILLETTTETGVERNRLKKAAAILDTQPILPADLLQHLGWASRYYHAPIGEVIQTALPVLLRQTRAAHLKLETVWTITPTGQQTDPTTLKRAPKQAVLLTRLQQDHTVSSAALNQQYSNWRQAMQKMVEAGWVEKHSVAASPVSRPVGEPRPLKTLNPDQHQAVEQMRATLGGFACHLLDGVTGSGKTEVYLNLIREVIAGDEQVLVLVPEIGLTPQLESRFRAALPCTVAVLHSGLNDTERLAAWLAAASGEAQVIIGTRSAVFIPLCKPGLFIIDEEHDLSYKQQDGFRYSARDLAIVRARDAGVTIVLGSATPSLESLANCRQGRYQHLILPARAGDSIPPRLQILDVRKQPMDHLVSVNLRQAMQRHLAAGGQVLLFLNRRGFAPLLTCHDCGWISQCPRCDSRLTLYRQINKQRCHHCGTERPVPLTCPDCGSEELRTLGYGTERIESALQTQFPDYGVLRIDRDATRRKGAMHELLAKIHEGEGRILIGTQMLAKGHHFPDVSLVGILDADYGLYSTDFRASERMAQLITQVAGRAGRAERPGEVLIQTRHPEHPLLQTLVSAGYAACADNILAERQAAAFPPYGHLALLRAESLDPGAPMEFLEELAATARTILTPDVILLGPIPSPMERRAGRYRAQLLLQAQQRRPLQTFLNHWLPQLEQTKLNRKVRWSLDVDPLEMF